ncbi:MAG TPA: hypothetical protein VI039_07450 [Solirubrobacterales bacterium]
MTAGDDCNSFNWDTLVPHLIRPVKVFIIEAMGWIDEPLSPSELDQVFEEEFGLSLVSYHVRTLVDVGALEKVGQQAVRGAIQNFYVLSAKEPADTALRCQ